MSKCDEETISAGHLLLIILKSINKTNVIMVQRLHVFSLVIQSSDVGSTKSTTSIIFRLYYQGEVAEKTQHTLWLKQSL